MDRQSPVASGFGVFAFALPIPARDDPRTVIGLPAARADRRLTRHLRRCDEAADHTDRLAELACVAALLAWAAALLAGFPAFVFAGAFAVLGAGGIATGVAGIALQLVGRQLRRGRWLAAHAALWSVLFPFRRHAARRARRLRQEARALRRAGISVFGPTR